MGAGLREGEDGRERVNAGGVGACDEGERRR